jgi:hypothetical protein
MGTSVFTLQASSVYQWIRRDSGIITTSHAISQYKTYVRYTELYSLWAFKFGRVATF